MSEHANNKLKPNKQLRRRWLTFMRMVRYGINNFSRNAWLTIAATAVMTITLCIVLTTLLARNVFADTVQQIRSKVDISIYLSDETKPEVANALKTKLEADPNVVSVRYISSREAREDYIRQNQTDLEQLQLISDPEIGGDLTLPQSLRVIVKDPGQLDSLRNLISSDSKFKTALNPDPKLKPTFEGDNSETINRIASAASFTEQVGLIASLIFVIISVLIIFNTVRMAIFNRKEEIQMMKLIGADRSFIRGPFIVEAVMYGFIAALISTGLIYVLFFNIRRQLEEVQVSIGGTINLMESAPALILLGMIVLGAILGIISSQLAVRRYLRV